MKRTQEGKRENRMRGPAVFLTGMILWIMAGCVGQTDTLIVSETTENFRPDGDGYEESPDTGGETKGSPEQRMTVREQAKVPETYMPDIRGKEITVGGNAEVEVQEETGIFAAEVRYAPYTEEELEKIKEVLKGETGIGEWSLQSRDNPGTYMSPDKAYNLSLAAGDERTMPAVWLTCVDMIDGSSGGGEEDDLSGFSMTEDEREKFQHEMEDRAERVMEEMGMEDFYLADVRWRQLSARENYSWSLSGQYGMRLYYRRKIGGMELVNGEERYAVSKPLAPAQYVEFLYGEDGRLLAVKNIGREHIKVTSAYTGFLLPFSSVCQVFEQCMSYLPQQELPVLTEEHPGAVPHLYLTVKSVKLAYCLEYEEWDLEAYGVGSGIGKLVPVWIFYGTAHMGYEDRNKTELGIPRTPINGGRKELLLMINAEDGTIYGRQ